VRRQATLGVCSGMHVRALPAFVIALVAASASAHDTWLLPRPSASRTPTSLSLALTSGMAFPTLESTIRPERVRRAAVRVGGRERALSSRAGAKALALGASGVGEGTAVAWVELHPRPLELTPAQVDEYLEEIGEKERVGPAWAARPEPKRWREVYRKLAKAVCSVGRAGGDDASWGDPVGLALEIVPETSPARVAPGGDFAVRVLKEGKPLADFAVSAVRAGGKRTLRRTDSEGRVAFVLDRPGPWMLAAVELRPAKDDEWESDFTTLTLTVAGPAKGVR
jgi:uncharacterized GH25 family protein